LQHALAQHRGQNSLRIRHRTWRCLQVCNLLKPQVKQGPLTYSERAVRGPYSGAATALLKEQEAYCLQMKVLLVLAPEVVEPMQSRVSSAVLEKNHALFVEAGVVGWRACKIHVFRCQSRRLRSIFGANQLLKMTRERPIIMYSTRLSFLQTLVVRLLLHILAQPLCSRKRS
jgi:hypothetical protein